LAQQIAELDEPAPVGQPHHLPYIGLMLIIPFVFFGQTLILKKNRMIYPHNLGMRGSITLN
jgi:hypothetical protein